MGGFTRQLAGMLQTTVHQAPLLEYIATDVNADYAALFDAQIPQLHFKASTERERGKGRGKRTREAV